MITIRDKIDLEIDWVIKETTKLKLIPHKYSLSSDEKILYLKSIVPMIYAYLEGFIKRSLKMYLELVNEKNLTYNEISPKLLVYKIEKQYNCFLDRFEKIEKKVNLINNFLKDIQEAEVKLFFNESKVQNINCDRLNKILDEFDFENIKDKKINNGLNKLLQYRNGIAHGENSYKVSETLIVEFIDTIINTMDIISDIIVKGYNEKKYLKE